MTKELFITKMEQFIKIFLEAEEFYNNAAKYVLMDDFYNYTFDHEYISLLQHTLKDKNGWLDYFIYECNCDFKNFIYYNTYDEKCQINNLGEFYDLITKES